MKKLLERIAAQLAGINYEDLSTAEKNIADMLIKAKYLTKEEGELKRPER